MRVTEAREGPRHEEGVAADAIAAFEAELLPLLLPAYRLAVGMLLDRALAEDAVQDASLRAWDRRASRRAGSELRPWFFAIVANCCRDVRRNRWRGLLPWGAVADSRPADPADVGAGIDLRRALLLLPRQSREAIVLRFYLDLPYEEVAAVLGCSVNAAKLRVSRAAAALRKHIGER